MSSSSSVYIYGGKSVEVYPPSKTEIQSELKEFGHPLGKTYSVPTAEYLKPKLDEQNCILILPGGSTIKMSQDLVGCAEEIREAVRTRGWNCLAFCAGANLVCQEVIQKVKEKISPVLDSKSLLGLLPMRAKIDFPPFENTAFQENTGRIVPIYTSSKEKFNSYWNQGSQFEITGKEGDVPVVASYYDKESSQIAAVQGKYGKGTVVACGFHPEISKDPSNESSSIKDKDDEKSSFGRKEYLHRLFKAVGIHGKGKAAELEEEFNV